MAHTDFYFAINATFYHFTEKWGEQALIDYWQALGREYLRPLARQFEQGGEVVVSQPDASTVLIDVRVCPAIQWLRESPTAALHPPVHPLYCQHCLHINRAMLEGTPYRFELQGGGGSCRQVFRFSPGAAP